MRGDHTNKFFQLIPPSGDGRGGGYFLNYSKTIIISFTCADPIASLPHAGYTAIYIGYGKQSKNFIGRNEKNDKSKLASKSNIYVELL